MPRRSSARSASTSSGDLEGRAAAHAALGDPTRLAIVDRLVVSDSTPGELADALGLASNLAAHHVGVLERAGLIERVVSSGDRRRRYLRLRAEMAELVSLRPEQPAGPALFVCTHNSARSQLAAALWRERTGSPATSAGTEPAARIHPGACRAAGRRGLELPAVAPRRLGVGEAEQAQLVITVCDRAHEEVPLPDHALHWSIPDPVETGTAAAFDTAADLIQRRIDRLISGSEQWVSAPQGS
jgi:protein-tyrosine-phosphatase/DNA-binding transcriptional ArsR family regulator